MRKSDFGEDPYVTCIFDERSVRALHDAVNFTLNNWSGQGNVDQEKIIDLRYFLQGAIFEFEYGRGSGG
ncbi:MAG: hypothetical protein CBD94_01565 [Gammaproteobacteria bacterium TMED234]|jgi:hypothetical protein|nr:MAG: hypothetical protein CBD94_01565 [Gammaproteobacteria bacterium TMED234]|tara:strand:+ start:593 stop:799 length:207 start_codon:yes stop_codon:yes gene_type:complete